MTQTDTSLPLQDFEQELIAHAKRIKNSTLEGNNIKQEQYTLCAAGLNLDYSRNNIDNPVLETLFKLAKSADVLPAFKRMHNGASVNNTEGRPALHTLLRSTRELTAPQNTGRLEEYSAVKANMSRFVNSVQQKFRTGATLKPFTDIVNIGIGGSDLGPAMAYQALSEFHNTDIQSHFVSNVDPQQIESTLANINPETTLFIVSSKSFTTQETLANAEQAKTWLLSNINADEERIIARHFVGVTAKPDKAKQFGLVSENIFPIWDWVGGRYSMWSAIGLALALSIGMRHFEQLLEGAREMDQHCLHSAVEDNIPVTLALLSIWHTNFWGCKSHAVIPYSQTLNRFPAYLQQLAMESNGKSVRLDGSKVNYPTCPIIWGEAGTNSQHSFFQLLHQGPEMVPVDFILPLTTAANREQHKMLIANCLAQSQALMQGKTEQQVREDLIKQGLNESEVDRLTPHKIMPGGRPSNIIYMDKLTPYTLGSLVSLYEHKTYIESVLWDINAFDQWGVELGKEMCNDILSALHNTDQDESKDVVSDSTTLALIEAYKKANERRQ